ncbi:hypothetical protein F4561_004842 [Lipingzhangella halophila]|uniref:Uncharacterized protein n=1 Tax=Lipingzhangella halophila TaxID=1783352 RepID=A0A7W7RL65_9ACTN|nr:DUF5691 domain-containing protein [Lipingzhangella halophila]MBB4934022.1 hypothetical protein [Lipingzhangella halophila]
MTEGDSQRTDTWQQLVSTALVGVNRRAVPETPGLPSAPASERAAELLDRAAAATVQQRAGYVPGTATPLPPAPADKPAVPDAAARRLDAVLAGDYTRFGLQDTNGMGERLLSEWLDIAAAREMRFPADTIPRMLDAGYADRDLRPAIVATAGTRGRWLAQFNPKWHYVTEYSAPDDRFDAGVWEHGTHAERRRALAAARAQEPARARELLEEVWSGEKAERRRELLLTLETNLSAEDEPFLERALDDRGATVRGTALALVTRLPSSAHAERLCAHARHYVWRGAPNRGGDHPLRVAAPKPTDSGLARDLALVTRAKGKDSTDVSGEWLWALVTHTPLRFWPEQLGVSPAEIGALAAEAEEWDLLSGLANAARVQEDPEWARALLPAIAVLNQSPRARRGQTPDFRTLLSLLPVEERCAHVARMLADAPKRALHGHYSGLIGLAGPNWTEELSERVAELIAEWAVPDSRNNSLPQLCYEASLAMPPAMYERYTPVSAETDTSVVHLEAALRFRHEMHAEFG